MTTHDAQKVRSFEHPGAGRRRAKATPKGRQIDGPRPTRFSCCSVTGCAGAIS